MAGISIPSHVKQRQARHLSNQEKYWSEPVKESLRPKGTRGPKLRGSEDAKVTTEKSGS